MDNLTVHLDSKPIYNIIFNDEFDSLLTRLSKQGINNRRICIVSETTVSKYYLDILVELLKGNCKEVNTFVFPAGEENKNLSVVQDLYEHLIISKFDRNDMLIALGGGVVGDLTGYAAATYLRGIDFVQVPTSLLSQVDSSIGGKTGVDFLSYKNMVGAFHMPQLVYININTLETLPHRQLVSGMGEIIKHGIIKDREYFEWLEHYAEDIRNKDLQSLKTMILKSCNIKRLVVENDPNEKGERALLNFGHTLGHAIEKLLDFSYLHGECVGIGSILASIISYNKGLISNDMLERIISIHDYFGFPQLPKDMDIDKIIETTKNDKKMSGGHIKFILINNIGEAYIDENVCDEDMRQAILDLYARY